MAQIGTIHMTIGTPEILSTTDLARMFRVATKTICKWIDSGMLPGHRLPGRNRERRVLLADALEFARRYEIPLELLAGRPPVADAACHEP